MKNTIKLTNKQDLQRRVQEDVLSSQRNNVIIQAGHFPLFYREEGAYPAIEAWRDFTLYSLKLGAEIGRELRDRGIGVKFAFICDDINYEDVGKNASFGRTAKKDRRHAFYKLYSGNSASLPAKFSDILDFHSFSIDDVIRHNHGKKGRRDCLFISETVLRARSKLQEPNQCARAYRSFIDNPLLFDNHRDYLVSFVPDRCSSNICNYVLEEHPEDLCASHIFMQTDSTFLGVTSIKSMWNDWGVFYRKDPLA